MAKARDCLATLYKGARSCFERGLFEQEAVAVIDMGPFANWANPGRYADGVGKRIGSSERNAEMP